MTAEVYQACPIKRLRRTNAELAVVDNAILEVVAADHPMTLRGVYYRVLSLGLIEKTEAAYQLVGRQLLKLRRSGALPYSWITDGTRYVIKPRSWSDLDEALADAAASYRRALWREQPVRVEIVTEKDAIAGLLSEVTSTWDVPLAVVRGFVSETFAWTVAEHMTMANKPTIVYQFGDHDPSGVAAWADYEAKVRRFAPNVAAEFVRVAVTPEQIETMALPTRPTKASDSRSRTFAGGSVEVDAIPPRVLRQLAEECIARHIDEHTLRLTEAVERSERDILAAMVGGAA